MSHTQTAARLLKDAGETFAAEAGITLDDKPAPLYRLLVLTVLLSSRVQAKLGTRACAELVDSDLGTPDKMRAATHQQVHDALDRAKFLSKDQTADALVDGAALVADRWSGDLRRLRTEADGDADRLAELLREVPRLGPVGADIFLREVQAVWPEFRPHLDGKATDGARAVGLPTDPDALAGLVDEADLARFAAALVRAALDDEVAGRVSA
ncbi:endonuclease [Actinomycetospora soli]|uniref:endonuclease n=1 Tax=Actinomycetospora soli TaxID=2893887 RepID=UPI001E304FD9|nr:endonuclease [Actinomycetospora soli]MCD2188498.1 endonuclease [Actinomycetospora soli]